MTTVQTGIDDLKEEDYREILSEQNARLAWFEHWHTATVGSDSLSSAQSAACGNLLSWHYNRARED